LPYTKETLSIERSYRFKHVIMICKSCMPNLENGSSQGGDG
jgi:predicted metal-binding protein